MPRARRPPIEPAPTAASAVQRPPAEVLYAEELEQLAAADDAPRPPGWNLSPQAVRRFVLGDPGAGLVRKFVGDPALVDRAMVTLATNRGLMLVGEPGTAKSLLSELLAAAISSDSTLTVQGSAATTEDQIRYSWNYALLLAEGPGPRALVPAPLLTAMREGKLVRFEEITRCPIEVQDLLLPVLSDRLLTIPEIPGDDGLVFAQQGFNLLATANTRDRGTNEMSAALKRRFNFETVFPIADPQVELQLVRDESARLLARAGVALRPPEDVLEVLVTAFRELRAGETGDGQPVERLGAAMSTAEAVSVAFALGVRTHYLGGGRTTGSDVVESLKGAALKDDPEDLARLRAYVEQRAARRKGVWREIYEARDKLS
jgi:MoxR-like ATPase